jgi:2-methylcitrate dehydratase PrpD
MHETAILARFAAEHALADIPADVRHASARCLLDYVGIALGAWDEPTVQIARAVADDLGGTPQASFLGGGRASMLHAATVNGIASHVLDFDDSHDPTILHGTGPVASAALAAAEWVGASGADLIAAHVVGFEVAARAALAVHPEHYDRGFHVTGTAGTIGAAAAAGRILDLDPSRMTHALSTAAAQAAGLREMFGSMSKSLHAGKAAANGLYSALLAQRGWVSAEEGLEGRRGYWAVLSDKVEPDRAVAEVGQRWELRMDGLKPYACGVVSHPTIDAVRRLHDRAGIPSEEVAEIRADVNPYVLELMGKREPAVGLEGKFSIYHCAAVAYIEGTARVRQFSDEVVLRPEVVALRRRVVATTDEQIPIHAAHVMLVAKDGRSWEETVSAATGTPRNPMSDEQIVEKFLDLVDGRLAPTQARAVSDRMLAIEREGDVRDLVALLTGSLAGAAGAFEIDRVPRSR